MHRLTLLPITLFAAALALAACGGGGDDASDADAPSGSRDSAEDVAEEQHPGEEEDAEDRAASAGSGASSGSGDSAAGDDEAGGGPARDENGSTAEAAGSSRGECGGCGTGSPGAAGANIANACLTGSWLLHNETFAFTFALASLANPGEFAVSVEQIGGSFVVTIAANALTVDYQEFTIPGTFTTSDGVFPFALTLDGAREYTLMNVSLESFTASLQRSTLSSTGAVAGINILPGQLSIPPLAVDG